MLPKERQERHCVVRKPLLRGQEVPASNACTKPQITKDIFRSFSQSQQETVGIVD